MKLGFEPRRYKTSPECPCGKSNKDGKFAPFKGETKYGKCHSCGQTFFPPMEDSNAPTVDKRQKYIPPAQIDHSMVFLEDDELFKFFVENLEPDKEKAQSHFRNMHVGRRNKSSVFWMVDQFGRICQPKSFVYNQKTGSKERIIAETNFNQGNDYYPCIYNLCSLEDDLPIIMVESEKTALFTQYFTKDYTIMSCGGANGLSMDKAISLRDREVIVAFDADSPGREGSITALDNLKKVKATVQVVDLFKDRVDGYDLGDFIVDFAHDPDIIEKFFEAEFDRVVLQMRGSGDLYELEDGIIKPNKADMLHRYINDIKDRGSTSHFFELDVAFKWKPGNVYTYTGYPGTGKSEINLFLAYLKAYFDGWRFILFVPESMSSNENGEITIEEIYDQLIHIHYGKPVDINDFSGVSPEEYEAGMDWVEKHFTIIYPKKGTTTQEGIIKQAEYVIQKYGKHNGIIIDPWNNVASSQRKIELADEYQRRVINEAKAFAVANRLCWIYITHPAKPQVLRDGSPPPLDGFSIRNGQAFFNGSDFLIVIDRPYFFLEEAEFEGRPIQGRNHPEVRFIVKKVKGQRLLNCRPNTIQLIFNRRTNRYENLHRTSPLYENYSNYTPTDESEVYTSSDSYILGDNDKRNEDYESATRAHNGKSIMELMDEYEKENDHSEQGEFF